LLIAANGVAFGKPSVHEVQQSNLPNRQEITPLEQRHNAQAKAAKWLRLKANGHIGGKNCQNLMNLIRRDTVHLPQSARLILAFVGISLFMISYIFF